MHAGGRGSEGHHSNLVAPDFKSSWQQPPARRQLTFSFDCAKKSAPSSVQSAVDKPSATAAPAVSQLRAFTALSSKSTPTRLSELSVPQDTNTATTKGLQHPPPQSLFASPRFPFVPPQGGEGRQPSSYSSSSSKSTTTRRHSQRSSSNDYSTHQSSSAATISALSTSRVSTESIDLTKRSHALSVTGSIMQTSVLDDAAAVGGQVVESLRNFGQNVGREASKMFAAAQREDAPYRPYISQHGPPPYWYGPPTAPTMFYPDYGAPQHAMPTMMYPATFDMSLERPKRRGKDASMCGGMPSKSKYRKGPMVSSSSRGHHTLAALPPHSPHYSQIVQWPTAAAPPHPHYYPYPQYDSSAAAFYTYGAGGHYYPYQPIYPQHYGGYYRRDFDSDRFNRCTACLQTVGCVCCHPLAMLKRLTDMSCAALDKLCSPAPPKHKAQDYYPFVAHGRHLGHVELNYGDIERLSHPRRHF